MNPITWWRLRKLRQQLADALAQDTADRSLPGDTRDYYVHRIAENAKLIRSLKYEIDRLESNHGKLFR